MFNSFIIRLFRVSMKLLSVLFFNIPKIFKILKFNEKNRFYRSILIGQTVLLLKKILKSLNYNLPITISKDKVIVEVDGVLIVTDKINRYFKISGNDKYYNQAKIISEFFDFPNKSIFIDIGACVGEYSIYFAKKFPLSKIYSIEANENNLKILKDNIRINKTEQQIKIFENAISNIKNQNYSVTEKGQESEVIISNNVSLKKTITLSSLISEEKIEKIDFLKIDIEGSNYKIAKCIIDNFSKINAIQYEFSKGPSNIFLDLINQSSSVYNFYILQENKFQKINESNLKIKIQNEGSEKEINFDVFFKKK